MSSPDSTPTPITELSLTMLSQRASMLADECENMLAANPHATDELMTAAQTLGALSNGFLELRHAPHGEEEERRTALIHMLSNITEWVRGL